MTPYTDPANCAIQARDGPGPNRALARMEYCFMLKLAAPRTAAVEWAYGRCACTHTDVSHKCWGMKPVGGVGLYMGVSMPSVGGIGLYRGLEPAFGRLVELYTGASCTVIIGPRPMGMYLSLLKPACGRSAHWLIHPYWWMASCRSIACLYWSMGIGQQYRNLNILGR